MGTESSTLARVPAAVQDCTAALDAQQAELRQSTNLPLHRLYIFVHSDNQGCMVAWRRHAVRCRLGIAERQAEEHHRKRYPEEFKAAFADFKLRFDNFVNQWSQNQSSARKRKRIHAYLTQVFGHHHAIWDSLQVSYCRSQRVHQSLSCHQKQRMQYPRRAQLQRTSAPTKFQWRRPPHRPIVGASKSACAPMCSGGLWLRSVEYMSRQTSQTVIRANGTAVR